MDLHISLVGRTDLSGEIYRQLRCAVLDGRLRAGERLPPTRELAKRLSVSRTTVTVAYDRLAGEGFVGTRVGAGTFVRGHVGDGGDRAPRRGTGGALKPRPFWAGVRVPRPFERPARFDFRAGLPDVGRFPHVAWRRLVSRELRASAVGGGVYGDAAGEPGLCEAIARHIGVSRGVVATAEDVTITNGTQQALDLLTRVLLAPGDRIAVEDPCYTPARLCFESHGVRVVPVPVDAEGLVVDALPAGARAVFTTPSHQFPLGTTMTLARRLALLEWAERHDAAILEDDYDSEFRYGGRPIEPLRTLDRAGRVVYVGSFSKTMLPTLRLGFVLTPPSLRDAVRGARFVTDWHAPVAMQRALGRFIEEGGFARHIRRMNRIYEERHAVLIATLERDFADVFDVIPSAAGLHVCAVAREDNDMAALAARAADDGVAFQLLSRFGMTPPVPQGLVLGFGAIETCDIPEGLTRLRRALP